MKRSENGRQAAADVPGSRQLSNIGAVPSDASTPAGSAARQSSVAKVSHTLNIALAERLEEFAFFQRVSESAVIEHSLTAFFAQNDDDAKLGDQLRKGGAGRRRKR